ncbi:MAG: DUF2508 family protein [Clostridia bacterium]|nr:DUF2508 family protein [Clostridia bacterium]
MQYHFKEEKLQKEMELLKTINDTKRDLVIADKNFESAEEELVDYYSYQIKANKSKLDYLIKQVKQKGIAVDMINSLEIGLEQTKAI